MRMMLGWLGWVPLAVAAEPPAGTADAPLRHTQAWVLVAPDGRPNRTDPSGLVRVNGELLVISDKADYPDIYRLQPGAAQTVQMELWRKLDAPTAGHDTEGLASCGNTLWIAVEQNPQLIRVSETGAAQVLSLDVSAIGDALPHPRLWLNAGLEGVACAPDGRLWVAKEREPRAILHVDPESGRVVSAWTERARTDTERTVRGRSFWPSWSGLQFDAGALYALHRDGHRIVRLDAETGAETASVQLDLDEALLYEDAPVWGMAEGLWLDAHTIWVVLDSNARLLRAGPRSGEPAPMLLRYDRPAGF